MESKSTHATFLGLLPELRLLIYDVIVQMDVDEKKMPLWKNEEMARRPEGFVDPDPLSKRLAWLNLLRTCKLVYEELDSMISNAGYVSRELYHTHEIDVVLSCSCETEKGYHRCSQRVTRQIIPCKPPHIKAIVLKVTLPGYCEDVRRDIDIARWIFRGVLCTLSQAIPRMHDAHRSDPRDVWLRKITMNVYQHTAAVADERGPRDMRKFDSVLRELFSRDWPTEEVHLCLQTTYASGPSMVSELHLTEVYKEKLRA